MSSVAQKQRVERLKVNTDLHVNTSDLTQRFVVPLGHLSLIIPRHLSAQQQTSIQHPYRKDL